MCKYCDGWETRIFYDGPSLMEGTYEAIGIVSNSDWHNMIPIENENSVPEGFVWWGYNREINPKNDGLVAVKLINEPIIKGAIDFDGVNIPINYCPFCGKKLV